MVNDFSTWKIVWKCWWEKLLAKLHKKKNLYTFHSQLLLVMTPQLMILITKHQILIQWIPITKFQLNIPKVSIMFYVPWIHIRMVANKSHSLMQALTEELEILGLCMIHSSKKLVIIGCYLLKWLFIKVCIVFVPSQTTLCTTVECSNWDNALINFREMLFIAKSVQLVKCMHTIK